MSYLLFNPVTALFPKPVNYCIIVYHTVSLVTIISPFTSKIVTNTISNGNRHKKMANKGKQRQQSARIIC